MSIAGISIKRSNNLPFMVRGTGANDEVERVDGENNDYGGDFTTHAGLIYQKGCCCCGASSWSPSANHWC